MGDRPTLVWLNLAAVACLCACACSGSDEETSAPPSAPTNAPSEPAGASTGAAAPGDSLPGPLVAFSAAVLPAYAPVAPQPVDSQALADLILPLNGGWERGMFEHRRVDLPNGSFAHAQAAFSSPEYPGPLLSLQISDGRGVPGFYQAFEVKWRTEVDDAALTYARFAVQGHPAVQYTTKPSTHTAISVLVAGRFLVDAECETIPPEELRRFLSLIDLSAMARLAK